MKRACIVLVVLLSGSGALLGAQNASEEEIRPIGEVGRGERVTIRGEVVRFLDEDEILVRDESGRIEVYTGSAVDPPPAIGEVITVTGRVDDDLIAIRRELYASTIIRADGTILEIEPRRWD